MNEGVFEKIIRFVTSRSFIVMLLISITGGYLLYRVFDLQIVHGYEYLENFQLKIEKERAIPGARGNIYDVNGNLLAYNELAYSVTMQDVYESGRDKDKKMNAVIGRAIDLIEKYGDQDGQIVILAGMYKYHEQEDPPRLHMTTDGPRYLTEFTLYTVTLTDGTGLQVKSDPVKP